MTMQEIRERNIKPGKKFNTLRAPSEHRQAGMGRKESNERKTNLRKVNKRSGSFHCTAEIYWLLPSLRCTPAVSACMPYAMPSSAWTEAKNMLKSCSTKSLISGTCSRPSQQQKVAYVTRRNETRRKITKRIIIILTNACLLECLLNEDWEKSNERRIMQINTKNSIRQFGMQAGIFSANMLA